MVDTRFDDVVVGSGVGGLFVGALLAASGRKVCVLERHYNVGGYGHSFTRPGYRFCAELHYVFNALAGEDGEAFFRQLGLEEEVDFVPLDPGGFDRLRFPGTSYDYVRGLEANRVTLSERFVEHAEGIRRYFNLLGALCDELYAAPLGFSFSDAVRHPLRFRNLVQYRSTTLQQLFDELAFPLELQAILAGQSLDIAEPPERASLLIHAGNSASYIRGACVPRRGFAHLFDAVARTIKERPGCAVRVRAEVTQLQREDGRVVSALLEDGTEIRGDRFVFNGDPQRLTHVLDDQALPARYRKRLEYTYSPSSFTLYLGLRDIDLGAHGFGAWNVWSYPSLDLNACYRRQIDDGDLSDPMLFLGTPTLHGAEAAMAPDGHHQLVVVTMCGYEKWRALRESGEDAYQREKTRVADDIIARIEERHIPGLRGHIHLMEAGSPLTNERYVASPGGNAYGQALTPENIRFGKLDYKTPLSNLFLVGATAGIPSFGGGMHCAMQLFEVLSGERVVPERSPTT